MGEMNIPPRYAKPSLACERGGWRWGARACPLRPQDPLSALERDLALQLQIAKAARRLCREENISKRLRKRRQTAALLEEQKLKDLENVLNQRRLLAGRRPLPTGAGTGAAEGEPPVYPPPRLGAAQWGGWRSRGQEWEWVQLGWVSLVDAPQNAIPGVCAPIFHSW